MSEVDRCMRGVGHVTRWIKKRTGLKELYREKRFREKVN